MSIESNKALLRGWWEALSQGRALDMLDEFYTADYVMHDPSQPEPIRGLDGLQAFITRVVTAFPDGHYAVEQLVVEGDRVAQLIRVTGTRQGDINGIPTNGKRVDIWLMVISRVVNNRIVEEWQLFDSLRMLQQLGVVSE